jgi:hypothetical protein
VTLLDPAGAAMSPAVSDTFAMGALDDHVFVIPSGTDLSGQHIIEIVKTAVA